MAAISMEQHTLVLPLTYQADNSFHIMWRFVHIEPTNTIVVLSIDVMIFFVTIIVIFALSWVWIKSCAFWS